jgi:hypothetical protein
MSTTTTANKRPKELSNFVFFLPSKFGSAMAGGDKAYLTKIRKAERPVIYIDRRKGSYSYTVLLDVVEGFSTNQIDLTEDTIAQIRRALRTRQTTKSSLELLDTSERVFYCHYRTLEDAVTVANTLAGIEYKTVPWAV